MRLVLRRLRGARTLLLAAAVATLIAVSFVVGLLVYGRDVVSAAAQTTIASAPPEERSVLVRGAADVGGTGLAEKDTALREAVRDGIGGRQVEVSVAGYSVGRQLTGPVGTAAGDTDGIVYGDVVFLENLAQHATLVSGAWAQPGAATTEVTLARAAAAVLEANVGARIPILDRRTNVTTEVVVVGIWEPTDLSDPYWRLAPGVSNGVVAGGNSYGPIALDRADFMRSWAADASVGWIVAPDLAGVGLDQLIQLRSGIAPLGSLPDEVGLAGTGQLSTRMDGLVDRLTRADLVGRSALLTPVLLIVVLGVYALLLIAMLLTEHRRAETALIRARGAARAQIAGLAAREATLLILPAILRRPPLGKCGAHVGWPVAGLRRRLDPPGANSESVAVGDRCCRRADLLGRHGRTLPAPFRNVHRGARESIATEPTRLRTAGQRRPGPGRLGRAGLVPVAAVRLAALRRRRWSRHRPAAGGGADGWRARRRGGVVAAAAVRDQVCRAVRRPQTLAGNDVRDVAGGPQTARRTSAAALARGGGEYVGLGHAEHRRTVPCGPSRVRRRGRPAAGGGERVRARRPHCPARRACGCRGGGTGEPRHADARP